MNLLSTYTKKTKLPKFLGVLGSGLVLFGFASFVDIKPAAAVTCSISVGGGGKTETVSRNVSRITTIPFNVSGWDFLRSTSGLCHFKLNTDYSGNYYLLYGSGITQRIRFGRDGGHDKGWGLQAVGYIPQPVSVTLIPANTSCGIILGDNGRSQTFWGSPGTVIDKVTGWSFIRKTWGGCRFTVYNGFQREGRFYSVNSGVNNRIRPKWRIRSIHIQ